MNLLLLDASELDGEGLARLGGRRLVHAREVLRAALGDTLRVGVLGGKTGTGEVLSLDESALVLRVSLNAEPPPRAAIDLLLAMPRPKALRRLLPGLASMGLGRIVLLNAARVEKSFFQSPVLSESAALFRLGLEQARDTVPPELLVRDRFRPFVEDELDSLFPSTRRLVAHPAPRLAAPGRADDGSQQPAGVASRIVLAIGPEGGWVPFELELLQAHGFTPFSFGERPLRVEIAVPYALGLLAAQGGAPTNTGR